MIKKLYRLVVVDEGMENGDGTFTTAEVHNAKYCGGTNQVKVKKIVIDGKEYNLIEKFL